MAMRDRILVSVFMSLMLIVTAFLLHKQDTVIQQQRALIRSMISNPACLVGK